MVQRCSGIMVSWCYVQGCCGVPARLWLYGLRVVAIGIGILNWFLRVDLGCFLGFCYSGYVRLMYGISSAYLRGMYESYTL